MGVNCRICGGPEGLGKHDCVYVKSETYRAAVVKLIIFKGGLGMTEEV